MSALPHIYSEPLAPPASRRLRVVPRPLNRSRPLVPLAIDAAAVIAATLAASVASGELNRSQNSSLLWLGVFDVLVLGISISRRTYRFRLSAGLLDELRSMVVATITAAGAVIVGRALLSGGPEAPVETLRWGIFAALDLAVVRAASYHLRRRRFRAGQGHPTLIVGAGTVGHQVGRRLLERPELGLRPVGFLDKEPRSGERAGSDLPVLGASWDLERNAIAHGIDHVVVAFSTAPHQVLVDIVRRSHKLGLHVLMVPRLFEEVSLGHSTEFVGGIPLQRIEPAARGWRLRLKYLIDRVVAGLILILSSPVLLAAAVAVRCGSSGPTFFRQRRVGLDGREFDMLKFRTMSGSPDGEGEADAGWVSGIVAEPEPGAGTPSQPDRRTSVGRLLRKCSIDELPQLINVLRGEMSLVGPRPERATLVPLFNQNVYRYADRHRMRCGITGWAQVHNLRGETSLVDRIEWDNRYIQHWSLWMDLKILVMTVPAMVRGN